MKHQITLVGGQLLPVFIGIKEFSPDSVHFIVSYESKEKVDSLKAILERRAFTVNICDPYDFRSIKGACAAVLATIRPADDLLINLTSGTKIMMMAAQSLIHEKGLKGFYINQDNSFLLLPEYLTQQLTCEITTQEVLAISGHWLKTSKALQDFSADDFKTAEAINAFADGHDDIMQQISTETRKQYLKVPKSGQMDIDSRTRLTWTPAEICVISEGKELLHIHSALARTLFFYASWWELIVAREIAKLEKATELLIQCELPFKSDANISKNEIDVLINAGGRLIFVECKSGLVRPDDINKMKAIKDTYGGLISKSLLVCRHKPPPSILEKCMELGINLFYLFEDGQRVNTLADIVEALEKLEVKLFL